MPHSGARRESTNLYLACRSLKAAAAAVAVAAPVFLLRCGGRRLSIIVSMIEFLWRFGSD